MILPDGTVYILDTLSNMIKHYSSAGEYLGYIELPDNIDGERVKIIDNLLRWKKRETVEKSEAEKWEKAERNMTRSLRRMQSNYRMQAHEIGHALGWYGHSTESADVMSNGENFPTTLTDSDKNQLIQIYPYSE